jgi:hypothetical protein
LLVGAGVGCGDDTTTSTMDMATAHDLAVAVPHDMATLTCAQVFSCTTNCVTSTNAAACAAACVSEGTTAAQGLFQTLETCIVQTCETDAGIDFGCAQTAVGNGGACSTQFAACEAG